METLPGRWRWGSNFVLQAQSGSGNSSNVGIISGAHDNVAVLQKGQGLFSNLFLLGVKGLTVDVLEPPERRRWTC